MCTHESQVYGIFQGCQVVLKDRVPRQIGELLMGKHIHGASLMGPNRVQIISAALEKFQIWFFSDVHYYKFKARLGSGNNNPDKLLALRCLLKFENEKVIGFWRFVPCNQLDERSWADPECASQDPNKTYEGNFKSISNHITHTHI